MLINLQVNRQSIRWYIRDYIWASLHDKVCYTLWDPIETQVRFQIYDQVCWPIIDTLWTRIRNAD
mgnify:CR=1 FL=1